MAMQSSPMQSRNRNQPTHHNRRKTVLLRTRKLGRVLASSSVLQHSRNGKPCVREGVRASRLGLRNLQHNHDLHKKVRVLVHSSPKQLRRKLSSHANGRADRLGRRNLSHRRRAREQVHSNPKQRRRMPSSHAGGQATQRVHHNPSRHIPMHGNQTRHRIHERDRTIGHHSRPSPTNSTLPPPRRQRPYRPNEF
jgi:hypothetical protein